MVKRDWPNIYFFLIITLLLAGLAVASFNYTGKLVNQQTNKLKDFCRDKGLELKLTDSSECIDSEGRIYDFDISHTSGYDTFMTIVTLGLILSSISFFCINVIGEYHIGGK